MTLSAAEHTASAVGSQNPVIQIALNTCREQLVQGSREKQMFPLYSLGEALVLGQSSAHIRQVLSVTQKKDQSRVGTLYLAMLQVPVLNGWASQDAWPASEATPQAWRALLFLLSPQSPSSSRHS